MEIKLILIIVIIFILKKILEKIFKKIMNVTPLKYRKTHQSVTIEHEELNTLDDSDYLD